MLPRNRVVIENISPSVDGGEFYAKGVIHYPITVTADIFGDGHDIVQAEVQYKHLTQRAWRNLRMEKVEQDNWGASFTPTKLGEHHFKISGWVDHSLNWQHNISRKIADGQAVQVELLDGIQYLDFVSKKANKTEKQYLAKLKKLFKNGKQIEKAQEEATGSKLKNLFIKYPRKEFVTESKNFRLWIDPKDAIFSSWYEFFPRSTSGDKYKHGSFKTAEKVLPYVADLGFSVVYFPPIHPIGSQFRKGKNNTTKASPSDVGSPWAIGNKEGGHKSIHPELGSEKDFISLIKKAQSLGLKVAMDYALQCSPDHPYVKEHPKWFKWRPDGSVQYAENPPKKYQDILPINFETSDWRNLWEELKSILEFWIERGIEIFRVDNPHTKPYVFWQWVIGEIKKKHPQVLFLSEAFTRPAVMHRLAKVGFSQSYTYFTWRNSKQELSEYMHELTQEKGKHYFRPNFWPNTPDINPYPMQGGNENLFLIRYFLAATLSSNYGIYGPVFEQMDHQALPGKEEYLDSEKYEVRAWNLERSTKLRSLIKMVNTLRNKNPALQDTYNFIECSIENEHIFSYLKYNEEEKNYLLGVVNLDPFNTQSGWVQLPLKKLKKLGEDTYLMHDLLTSNSYYWDKEWNYVELNPHVLPFHLFQIKLA